MITAELEFIEALIENLNNGNETYIVNNSNVINNIFNRLSINILLSNTNRFPSFNVEKFLKTGIVSGLYEDKIEGITVINSSLYDYRTIYLEIIDCLKNNMYLFDNNSNIIVANDKIQVSISSELMYRLANAMKKNKKEKVFFFNKKPLHTLRDHYQLKSYLNELKSLVIRFYNPNNKYQKDYLVASEKAVMQMLLEDRVSVSSLADILKQNLDNNYDIDVLKFKLNKENILKKADSMDKEFYKLSIYEQKKYLNQWVLDFLNINNKNDSLLQIFLLLKGDEKNKFAISNKTSLLISLAKIYMLLLKEYNIDFNTVSLSDFRIKDYCSLNEQNNLVKLNKIIKNINSSNNKELNDKRNSLLNIIRYQELNDITDLAFDNEAIYDLLCDCIINGKVYQNPVDNKKIIFELTNHELGRDVFVTSISLKKLIEFVKINNMKLSNDLLKNKHN